MQGATRPAHTSRMKASVVTVAIVVGGIWRGSESLFCILYLLAERRTAKGIILFDGLAPAVFMTGCRL